MKKYAAREHWMDHSLQPKLHEFRFEVENPLLTVPRAIGNAAGSLILLELEITEGVKGSSLTHWKCFYNNDIDTWEDWKFS